MSAEKNKKHRKPAVGKPAAGSNNKREKTDSHKKSVKQTNVKNNNKSAAKNKNIKNKNDKPKPVSKSRKEKLKKTDFAQKKLSVKEKFEKFRKDYDIGRIALAIAVVIIFIAGIIILIVSLTGRNYSVPDYVKDAGYKGRTEPDSVAFDMDISLNQQKSLVKATKRKGEKRKFGFFINDEIKLAESDEPALLEFGNVESNDCVLVFFLFDEKGNEIYRSLGVAPGKEVRSASFFDEISYGTHDITVAVIGYDPQTFEKTGMQTSKLKLKIGVD